MSPHRGHHGHLPAGPSLASHDAVLLLPPHFLLSYQGSKGSETPPLFATRGRKKSQIIVSMNPAWYDANHTMASSIGPKLLTILLAPLTRTREPQPLAHQLGQECGPYHMLL